MGVAASIHIPTHGIRRMRRIARAVVAVLPLLASAAVAQQAPAAAPPPTRFFITSANPGNGANLGGLDGGDAHCAALAGAAGLPSNQWRAYLSATPGNGQPGVNARDRIGAGPWHNVKGQLIAKNVDELHSELPTLTKASIITEKGDSVNGRGDRPNTHDILTGSTRDGRFFSLADDTTCDNWTLDGETGSARVGHHDRQGGGEFPTSWNSAHPSRGCGPKNLQASGGAGLFFCFGAS